MIRSMMILRRVRFQINANNSIPQENNNDSNRSTQPKTIAKKSKDNFQGVLKYSLININTLELRRSQYITKMIQKQLDSTLNHVGFIQVNKASEEDMVDPMKETFIFKEAIASPCKKQFVEAIKKEMKNHIKCKH